MKKERLTDKQVFLIINGPSCGGKSSVADVLTQQYGDIYLGRSDHLKWMISDYEAEIHRSIVTDMTLATLRVALRNGLSVLKEGALYEPERLIGIAREFSVPVVAANVTAPREILQNRFLERVEAKKGGARISNGSQDRFDELQQMYLDTKMETSLEFDSSKQSSEEIAGEIATYIKERYKLFLP